MCRIDSQPNIDKLKDKLGFGWHIFPIKLETKKANDSKISPLTESELFCIHCGSSDIVLVGIDEYQTVSGDSIEWVYNCNTCKKT
ncbi:MAG: hypothetical protein HC831_05270 [Chloroflexia bacterium]|nr:hypothetical protein [Chloroflexia bacterium]